LRGPTTKSIPRDASNPGPAIHPGEILVEEFLEPLEMTQAAAAKTLEISTVRLNELVRGERGVTATAGATFQGDAGVLDADAGQLRSQGSHGSSAHAEASQAAIGLRVVPLVQSGARRHGTAGIHGISGIVESVSYRIQTT
jgi:hypothetical protein